MALLNAVLFKKVLPNITRTKLFIKFKTITTCVPVCIVNRQRYIAQSVYHLITKKLGHIRRRRSRVSRLRLVNRSQYDNLLKPNNLLVKYLCTVFVLMLNVD